MSAVLYAAQFPEEASSHEPYTSNEDRISAAELRAIGCKIDENIPDYATVPRIALVFGRPVSKFEGDTLHVTLPVTVLAPFRWLDLTFTIESVRDEKENF